MILFLVIFLAWTMWRVVRRPIPAIFEPEYAKQLVQLRTEIASYALPGLRECYNGVIREWDPWLLRWLALRRYTRLLPRLCFECYLHDPTTRAIDIAAPGVRGRC